MKSDCSTKPQTINMFSDMPIKDNNANHFGIIWATTLRGHNTCSHTSLALNLSFVRFPKQRRLSCVELICDNTHARGRREDGVLLQSFSLTRSSDGMPLLYSVFNTTSTLKIFKLRLSHVHGWSLCLFTQRDVITQRFCTFTWSTAGFVSPVHMPSHLPTLLSFSM